MAINYFPYKKWTIWDFPGSPVVKTLPSNAGGAGLIPGGGSEIPRALRPTKPKHKIEAVL